ncbi:MAG TPA: hypothetical protein VEK15_10880 [Vicinamibacteria bacterium]|nr:hypothetical protein [Vicinamibacteria bacterium]
MARRSPSPLAASRGSPAVLDPSQNLAYGNLTTLFHEDLRHDTVLEDLDLE